MRLTTCDKCKKVTKERNPKAVGWTDRLVTIDGCNKYVDLCPDCNVEFDKIKNNAWSVFNFTVQSWLESNVITKEVENDP